MAKQVIVAYVPVIHEGYRRFFEKYPKAATLYVLSREFTPDYKPLAKDIRALEPELVKASLEAWKVFTEIVIAGKQTLLDVAEEKVEIIMPDEEVCRDLAEKYFKGRKIIFDTVFLRWDKHKAMAEKPVEEILPALKSLHGDFSEKFTYPSINGFATNLTNTSGTISAWVYFPGK